ncbi:type II secretion system protein F (GspF) [Corynebacterium mycetoides]|uniref:Type II secretion system protein F (GspF) n=1 Tax=Corynebacterium mycetoides TaxID=38302 RepID=A0A1G9Q5U0_9CORY|nr:type II secretion system F family protein [Corynebacterium mycetoides]SDM06378.1 type II secretion system protein F (GspF) [Corynebacterium mycetoides]
MNAVSSALIAAALATPPPRPAHRLGGATHRTRLHPAVIPAAVFVVSLAVIVSDRLALVVSLGIAGMTLARAAAAYRDKRQARRNRAIVAGFLGHVVTHLEAGSTPSDSCRRAEDHLPDSCPAPLARDLRQLGVSAAHGAAPHDTAGELGEVADVAALWALAVNRGLPLAALLAQARDRIDAQQRHRAATEAALAGPKTTAVVLSLLPLAGVAMGSAMGANPLGLLLGPGAGGWLLVAGTALVCAGFLACQHIIGQAAA